MSVQGVAASLRALLAGLQRSDAQYFVRVVDGLLDHAIQANASDVHLQPGADRIRISFRIDGALSEVATLPHADGSSAVARLKVLAGLLTYQTDVPQEGRIAAAGKAPEMRVGVFPTIHGERSVVRIFAAPQRFLELQDLGFAEDLARSLQQMLDRTSGLLAVTGPAGSGKTTTLYACIREIVGRSARNVVTVEDPVETVVDGVAQAAIRPATGFDFPMALRSLMRQDPDVIVVGEVRDTVTAQAAFQASLTGHLVLTSFHAGTAAAAIRRFVDMGIETHVVQSGLLAAFAQRLLRRQCKCMAGATAKPDCARCAGAGYEGRYAIGELLHVDMPGIIEAIGERAPAAALQALAIRAGMAPLADVAKREVEKQRASSNELARIFGGSG